MREIAILDGYNNKTYLGGVIGTIVPQNSRWGLTNGYKIIEIFYEQQDYQDWASLEKPTEWCGL